MIPAISAIAINIQHQEKRASTIPHLLELGLVARLQIYRKDSR
jgi:hypothetical protein